MMHILTPRPPADPRDAAIWWATRAQMDPAAYAADAGFSRWHDADPEHAAAWREVAVPLEAVGAYAALPELRAMRDAALEVARTRRSRPVQRYWLAGGAVAAGLAAAVMWIAGSSGILQGSSIAEARLEAPQRHATLLGERRNIRLSDGSQVALNTASILDVVYTAGRRDVRLIAGQAMFRVAKDPARPFVVAAGNRRITATGTAFDVRVDEGEVRVLLVEGRVRVEPAHHEGLARLIPALARENLDPGQQLSSSVNALSVSDIAVADIERNTAWTRGQLVFRAEPLLRAIDEVNRYSNIRIALADTSLEELRVSGVFPATGSADFVAALQALYPVSIERRTASLAVLKWRDPDARQD